MKPKKDKKRSKHEKRQLKKRSKKSHRKETQYNQSSSSSSSSGDEQEWVEKPAVPVTLTEQSSSAAFKEQEAPKREEWMNMKSIFPCVHNEKKCSNDKKKADKPDLDKPGQSNKELNPYWKDGGDGLPGISSKTDPGQIMDAKWLKKSLQRAKEQAENEGTSLEEIAAKRWGSLEVIESMIFQAERASRSRFGNSSDYNTKWEFEKQSRNRERREDSYYSTDSNRRSYSSTESRRNDRNRSRSRDRYVEDRMYDNLQYRRQEYKKTSRR